LVGGTLATAAVTGAVVGFVQQWFYFVLIFPLFMGVGVGLAGAAFVKIGRVRNPAVAGLVGLLGGLAVMASAHYCEYVLLIRELEAQVPGFQQAVQAGRFSFFDFFELRANEGVQIGRVGHGNAMNLGYYGSYIYWVVEAAIAAGMAFVMTRPAAAKPFCSRCSTWKQERPLGMVDIPWQETVANALHQGEFLKVLGGVGPVQGQGLLLKASSCANCGEEAPVDVALELISLDHRGRKQTKTVAQVTYPGEVLRHLGTAAGAGGA
jgi:hypothetical protein